jgi:hypothetical protein
MGWTLGYDGTLNGEITILMRWHNGNYSHRNVLRFYFTKFEFYLSNLLHRRQGSLDSGFGGLEVACWPLIPKFRGGGFKPGRSRRIFSGEKILSTPSFGGEVKPSVPCRRLTACKRTLNATWKSGISSKIHRPFLARIVPPLATRISRGTTSGERLERLK